MRLKILSLYCLVLIFSAKAAATTQCENLFQDQESVSLRQNQLALKFTENYLENLMKDYRVMLEVYYGLKITSDHPKQFTNTFTPEVMRSIFRFMDDEAYSALPDDQRNPAPWVDRLHEFNSSEYMVFAKAMAADPRLSGNLYLLYFTGHQPGHDPEQKMIWSADNDLLQRAGQFVDKKIEKIANNYSEGEQIAFSKSISNIAMLLSKLIFNDVSRISGYPGNVNDLSNFEQLGNLNGILPIDFDRLITSLSIQDELARYQALVD